MFEPLQYCFSFDYAINSEIKLPVLLYDNDPAVI